MVRDSVRDRVRDPHRAWAPHRQRRRPVAGVNPCPPLRTQPNEPRPHLRLTQVRGAAGRAPQGHAHTGAPTPTPNPSPSPNPCRSPNPNLTLALALARSLVLTPTLTLTQERVDYLNALGFEWEPV